MLHDARVGSRVRRAPVGRGRAFAPEPSLALSWKAIDASVWRFALRPDACVHLGPPWTSDGLAIPG